MVHVMKKSGPVQTTYGATQAIGYPGMPATMHTWDADSFIAGVELPFARAVGVDPTAGKEKQLVLAGAIAGFAGVTYRDVTADPQPDGWQGYPQYMNVGVMMAGDIWVDVKEAVLHTDIVAYDATTGQFGKTGVKVDGRWMRGQATIGGVALLRLYAPKAAPAAAA